MAVAQPAPITYAGQGGGAPTQTASLGDGLAGGGDNSYGYGSTGRSNGGAVIDLRRPASGRARVEPVQAAPGAPQRPAPAVQQSGEEGAQPWLERERVGPPYEANGRWYVPTPEPGYSETGTASWYGPQFHGQRTASGETFDQEALTAAHPTLPIPSLVQVTNLENGREVIVRVNDRGPFVGERLIDLSRRSAEVLGFEQAGQARVHVRYLGPAPRRVNADGTPAPASPSSPPPFSGPVRSAAVEPDGPRSLLPPPSAAGEDNEMDLAGAPVGESAYSPPAPRYTAPPPVDGGYFVQVGAFSDLANAHRARDAVSAAGPVVVDVRRSASGVELFRVRVGPWASAAEAETARRTLASMGYGETIVASR